MEAFDGRREFGSETQYRGQTRRHVNPRYELGEKCCGGQNLVGSGGGAPDAWSPLYKPRLNASYSHRGVQPVACGPHVSQDGYECSPTQNHKFT